MGLWSNGIDLPECAAPGRVKMQWNIVIASNII